MIRSKTAALAATLLFACVAEAATPLVSPPVPGSVPGLEAMKCTAINVGSKDAEVTVDIVDAIDGSILVTVGPSTVAPNVRTSASVLTTDTSFCRLTGLTKKNGAVVFYGTDASGNPLMTVTAP